ncbi:predicted protein [Methanosarcina acetivorans C2A]|uniref:Uncharacterized protein n=1 Tax=Methanosarcina acetivorans (strain ATCC 35395 / DSM 2834 / JCM 12185 / C2A) TaxID=188937 RepID=Q8TM79_METAC|nr:predicted protein [Methanosarcina acetivorans C2A]
MEVKLPWRLSSGSRPAGSWRPGKSWFESLSWQFMCRWNGSSVGNGKKVQVLKSRSWSATARKVGKESGQGKWARKVGKESETSLEGLPPDPDTSREEK